MVRGGTIFGVFAGNKEIRSNDQLPVGVENSFQAISSPEVARKLLNVRSPQALKFAEITGLVPF
jgi:hypothetical protein